MTTRPLESSEEKELLPPGSTRAALGAWGGWSPDGKWIYYTQANDKPGFNDLWRLNVATLKKELLIKNAGGVSTSPPTPSPDGASIAFFRGKSLMLAGAEGRNERVLYEEHDPSTRGLVWSADSSQLLFPIGFYDANETKLGLLTVATKQVKSLAPFKGSVFSMVWPSWSSGPFLVGRVWDRTAGYPLKSSAIWYLSLPQDQRTEITHEPARYAAILGAGADGFSLVAQRMVPPPSGWDHFVEVLNSFGMSLPVQGNFHPSVILMLKK